MQPSKSNPGPFRQYFDPQIPYMAFRQALTPDQWDTLGTMADDEEFSGASDPNIMSLLFALVRSCGMRRVLQIGTRIGFSAIILASGLLGDDALLLTVDPWEPSVDKARRYVAQAGLSGRVQIHIGRSLDASTLAESRKSGPWDLIYVDGDHDFAVVREELDRYWPLLRQGGFLVLHDASAEMGREDTRGEGGVHAAVLDWQAASGVQGIMLSPPVWNPCGAFLTVKD